MSHIMDPKINGTFYFSVDQIKQSEVNVLPPQDKEVVIVWVHLTASQTLGLRKHQIA